MEVETPEMEIFRVPDPVAEAACVAVDLLGNGVEALRAAGI
jgi:hypothetical protein